MLGTRLDPNPRWRRHAARWPATLAATAILLAGPAAWSDAEPVGASGDSADLEPVEAGGPAPPADDARAEHHREAPQPGGPEEATRGGPSGDRGTPPAPPPDSDLNRVPDPDELDHRTPEPPPEPGATPNLP